MLDFLRTRLAQGTRTSAFLARRRSFRSAFVADRRSMGPMPGDLP